MLKNALPKIKYALWCVVVIIINLLLKMYEMKKI